MSKKDGILNLVLKKEWFDKIASGEKTHEYREAKPYWKKILGNTYDFLWFKKIDIICPKFEEYKKVRFQCGYQKNAQKMLFKIKGIDRVCGKDTDLKIDKPVYDIELGDRLE